MFSNCCNNSGINKANLLYTFKYICTIYLFMCVCMENTQKHEIKMRQLVRNSEIEIPLWPACCAKLCQLWIAAINCIHLPLVCRNKTKTKQGTKKILIHKNFIIEFRLLCTCTDAFCRVRLENARVSEPLFNRRLIARSERWAEHSKIYKLG